MSCTHDHPGFTFFNCPDTCELLQSRALDPRHHKADCLAALWCAVQVDAAVDVDKASLAIRQDSPSGTSKSAKSDGAGDNPRPALQSDDVSAQSHGADHYASDKLPHAAKVAEPPSITPQAGDVAGEAGDVTQVKVDALAINASAHGLSCSQLPSKQAATICHPPIPNRGHVTTEPASRDAPMTGGSPVINSINLGGEDGVDIVACPPTGNAAVPCCDEPSQSGNAGSVSDCSSGCAAQTNQVVCSEMGSISPGAAAAAHPAGSGHTSQVRNSRAASHGDQSRSSSDRSSAYHSGRSSLRSSGVVSDATASTQAEMPATFTPRRSSIRAQSYAAQLQIQQVCLPHTSPATALTRRVTPS